MSKSNLIAMCMGVAIGFSPWCYGGDGRQSFTPTSIRIPLRAVYLSGTSVATLYECQSDQESDCMIDVADLNALGAVINQQSEVPEGTYDRIVVQTCKDQGIYHAEVTGSAMLEGKTYFTTPDSGILSPDLLDSGPVKLEFHGCQRDYQLPQALKVQVKVQDGSPLALSLFIPVSNIASMGLAGSPIPEGCIENDKTGSSVCLSYPDVSPYVGATVPKLESYAIYELPNDPDTAGGQVLLMFDANDQLISGTTRPLYTPKSIEPKASYVTPMREARVNQNGHLYLANFGSTAQTSYLVFPDFIRGSHVGHFISYNYGGQEFEYGAVWMK